MTEMEIEIVLGCINEMQRRILKKTEYIIMLQFNQCVVEVVELDDFSVSV